MTRINANIPVKLLTDSHLQAEHREIKRLPFVANKRLSTKTKVPNSFCLGTGHVLFFVNKGNFTLSRYIELRDECIKRGFDITDYSVNWNNYPKELMGNWIEKQEDNILAKQRIIQRIKETNQQQRYYRKNISKQQAIKIINNEK